MLGWMVYVVVVSAILGASAFVAEHAAQMRRAPTRWLWAASIVASTILPLVMSSIGPPAMGERRNGAPPTPQILLPLGKIDAPVIQPSAWIAARPAPLADAASPGPVKADTIVACVWGAASAAIILAIALGGVRLHRRKRGWQLQLMHGAPVYVSEDVGPAIVGLLHPSIVVPRWIADAAPQTQALVLAHEQSHLDANDARLLALAVLVLAAVPWNLPLWWQLRRLRFAIEVDCDTRVLKSGYDLSRYGETLILVGERQSGRGAVVAAMSESKSFLEQRIRKMLWKPKRLAWTSVTALGGLGFVLAASAAVVSPPGAAAPSRARLLEASGESAAAGAEAVRMKHYRDGDWNFALDIPTRWNAFPPVPSNSPFEVIRFASNEDGVHNLIVFRNPRDPAVTLAESVQRTEAGLAEGGFSHFTTSQARIGSRQVLVLDFDKPEAGGKLWSCREYFIEDGALLYVLGFGTTDRATMFALFDRMAKSFTIDASAS